MQHTMRLPEPPYLPPEPDEPLPPAVVQLVISSSVPSCPSGPRDQMSGLSTELPCVGG